MDSTIVLDSFIIADACLSLRYLAFAYTWIAPVNARLLLHLCALKRAEKMFGMFGAKKRVWGMFGAM